MTSSNSSSTQHADLLAQARTALGCGDATSARERAEQLLQMVPGHAEAHYVAGRACMQLRRWPEALDHLNQATRLRPHELDCVVEFAVALTAARRTGDALQAANRAMALAPADPLVLSTLGLVYSQSHAHERAAAVFRRAAALAPENAACRFNLGMALAFSGDIERSEVELEACLALAPTCWPAYNLRSRLRRQTPAANHVEALRGWLSRVGNDPGALTQLHMALGKELEDLGEHAQAFGHFRAGKSAAPTQPGYSSAQDEALVRALEQAFAAPPDAPGCPTFEPIFVFGMPRSGTTLVERILTSHPEVQATGELEDFPLTLERFLGAQAPLPIEPCIVARTPDLPWRELGEAYLRATRPATAMKPRFVDKFPHNFLYAGFIATALPNARLVCLRRNPLDTCLGNFREPFSEASPYHRYAFDLSDIGRYYILFDRLMAHWRRVLPGRILEVDYEALVEAPEATTRQLLEYCDLPWHDACLHFERNQAASPTASTLQVRSPIHKAGVGRWRQYAIELSGLRELLQAAGIDCGE
jgi:tetratricopeptide (TPR) repeat protein